MMMMMMMMMMKQQKYFVLRTLLNLGKTNHTVDLTSHDCASVVL